MKTTRLLLVDDEPHILSALSRALRHELRGRIEGLQMDTECEPQKALERLKTQSYALVISDFRMPGMTGAELLGLLKILQPYAGRVILSGQVDRDGLMAAINAARIHRFLSKPWEDAEVAAVVLDVLQQCRQEAETDLLADIQRARQNDISPQELERRRLERLEPGITRVQWDLDGAYQLEPPR
ncbi:response regulator [Roseateles sp. BYS180W]|uniref:Response regulator n=1 Tax=Roseateles rivi TaxID=3299028 RepID=A0ABW7FT58_9BURK